jgi:RNA polymerase sigma factor (sigma-70 family)
VLRGPQDAEDAFQATFLVLVRKAASLRQRELLGNWLYGVAYRTALDARAAAARRQARERQVSAMPEPEVSDGADVGRDLRPLLDQALSRLPDKYRVPIVLCYLEGRTQRDVARQLGLPAGTLSGRLTAARGLLARRLARHGLTLAGGALTAALSEGAASAGLPSPLVASVVEAATALAAGHAAAPVVSARVADLAGGVLKAMRLKKLKIATAVLLAAATVIGAAAVVVPAGGEARDAGAPKVLKLDGKGRRVAWSPDGRTLAVVEIYEPLIYGRKGSAIKLWDVDTGRVRQTLAESAGGGLAFQQVVFSPDGEAIAATASEEVILPNMRQIRDVVKVWDAKTLALRQTLGGDSHLVCLAWSPDGKRVAAGDPGRKSVTLWDAGTGAPERTLRTGAAQPWSVAFSPDGDSLVVGGQKGDGSGEVTQWDTKTGNLKHTLKRPSFVTAVAFAPDGQTAADSGGESIQIWRVESGEAIASLKSHPRGHRSLAFSPDGRTVAAGGPDGKVRLWDARTGEPIETLAGHAAEVHAVAFSPDGKTLASVSQDQTVRLWPIEERAAEPK